MNKTIVITGASGGIGIKLVDAFARNGYNVAAAYFSNKSSLISACENLTAEGFSAFAVKADVSKSDEANGLIDCAIKKFGNVDALINNAGIAQQKLFTDITDDDFTKMFDINVRGVFNCCRAVLPNMIHNKYGRIINISSMWGICGASCEVHYSASKAAVIGMTKALAKEVGPSGITVNCIAPGLIDTPMNSNLTSETINELCSETPVGRIGTPNDVANAALFLVSEQTSFITGQVLGVDGGFI